MRYYPNPVKTVELAMEDPATRIAAITYLRANGWTVEPA